MIQVALDAFDTMPLGRYDALRRLVARYELGELSDEDFIRLKKQLLRDVPIQSGALIPEIDLLLATFDNEGHADIAQQSLEERHRSTSRGLIDAAMIARLRSGTVRIRTIPGLTRPLARGHISIISGICGILFPLDVLLPQHLGTPLAASFGAFTTHDTEQAELRSVGGALRAETTSMLIICWSAAGSVFSTALEDANDLVRHRVSPEVATGITMVLSGDIETIHGRDEFDER